nr:hypothetical protein [Tanacetum cinerariifolium]
GLVLLLPYCCYDLQTLGFVGRLGITGHVCLVTWVGGRGVKEKIGVVPSAKAAKDTIVVSSFVVEESMDATVNTEDGRSSYAREMIELCADVELKDTIVVAMPKLYREGFYTCTVHVEYEWKPPRCACCKVFGHIQKECPKNPGLGVAKNSKKPSQAPKGVSVGLKVGFKPAKEYRHVLKKPTANSSGNKKKDMEPTKEVGNSNPFDVLNLVENNGELGTNGGIQLWLVMGPILVALHSGMLKLVVPVLLLLLIKLVPIQDGGCRDEIASGSELTKDDRESQLYDEYEHFGQHKGENIYDYYIRMLPEWGRFVTAFKLNRGLKESNHDHLYAYLNQHELHANENKMLMKRLNQHSHDPLALVSNVSPYQTSSGYGSKRRQHLLAMTMIMANLSYANPVYDEAGLSYDSDTLFEVQDHDNCLDNMNESHEEHDAQ